MKLGLQEADAADVGQEMKRSISGAIERFEYDHLERHPSQVEISRISKTEAMFLRPSVDCDWRTSSIEGRK
ncbi:MAG: hypothetical protein O3C21_17115 [Verrucomicrobia bacterium]|nr:hypothetical protein [Verrucomicrobiota bacterium]